MAEAKVTSRKAELTYAYIYDLYGQLWARQDKQTGKLEYYQFNGHGDVVGIVDDAGQVLNEYTYDIWGGTLTTEETVQNVLRYAGEYWDETVGLQYLRASWYHPGMARFIGEDTYEGELSDPLSLNLYSYVSNNPLKYVDPSGHKEEMGAGSGGGGGGITPLTRVPASRRGSTPKSSKTPSNSKPTLGRLVNVVTRKLIDWHIYFD
ncbi:RHS repeat-associated core domain-containing protein [Paenibacillus pabuli]|uniref:RHS repeat-associated core domain-containing protein n=1 Tax=Paenibacillus pabuli TaxID=1472 RepID=UPI00345A7BEE